MNLADCDRPVVSVVVPAFNRLSLLEETLSSLEAQTLRGAEFLLVDDRSGAETIAYLEEVCRRDLRFRLLRKPNGVPQGCQASRNLGIDASRGMFVMFLDSDDLLAPDCLKDRLRYIEKHPDVDIVVGNQATIDFRSGEAHWINQPVQGEHELERFLRLGDPLDVPWVNGGCLFRAERLRESGLRWRTQFHWDDVVFHFECLLAGFKVGWMLRGAEPDSWYRLHTTNPYGATLHSAEGLANTVDMLGWMTKQLRAMGQWNATRRQSLARSWFHLGILKSVDAGNGAEARRALAAGTEAGIFGRVEALALRLYLAGRALLRSFPRLTFFWNRFARLVLVRAFFSAKSGTYRSEPVASGIVQPVSASA
jgi:hypothetical protein